MKKIINILLSVALTFVLAGCSNNNIHASNQHLNVAMFWISTSLDPANDYDGWVLSRIGVGETLLKLNENYEVEACLADTWEQLDDTSWKFHIRDNITFSNGKNVDGEMVKLCIERAFSKNIRAKDYFDLASIEADGQNVILHLNSASGAILNNLCEPLFTIYDASENNIENMPSCTGPFIITDYKPEASIDTKRNENYWDGEVKLDTVHFKQVVDSDARILALQTGEVDLATTIDYTNLSLFQDTSKYTISEVLGPRCNVVYMNNNSAFLSNKVLRQALSYAIDRESIVKLTGGEVANSLYSTVLPYGKGLNNPYTYDLQKANELLDANGYQDTNNDGIREMNGQNIILEYYESADHGSSDAGIIAQAIQNEAKQIGISVEIKQVENLADIKAAGTFDMCSANDSSAPTGDPEIFLQLHYRTGVSGNIGRYSNENVDQLINQLSVTFDLEQRQEIALNISQLLLDDAANLYISYLPLNTVTAAKVINAKQHPVDYYMITKDIAIKDE